MTHPLIANPDTYYQDNDYLSSSSLSNFCSFDVFGNPTYNIHEFLNPSRKDSSAILIWQLSDKILTEWFNLDDEYGPTLDKAGMQKQLDLMNIEYNKADTNPVLRGLLERGGYKFKKELGKTERDAIESIVNTAHNFQYDENTRLMEYIAECDCQKICVDEAWWVKWKFDFLNRKKGRISDLKTTWNLERILKEMFYKGQPNVYHKYIRQLAIYQHLYYLESGEQWECELIFIDYKGHHCVKRIGQRALDKALEQVMKDIEVLKKMYSGEMSFIQVIDIDEETAAAIDSHTTPVMEAVAPEEDKKEPDYLITY